MDDLDGLLDEMIAAQMDDLFVPIADGVHGLVRDLPGRLEIGGVRADVEGSGAVGRYLDALPRDRKIVVPYVTSDRLAGMLARRGFVPRQRFDPTVGGWGWVWLRRPG